jgi:hypothetical protein
MMSCQKKGRDGGNPYTIKYSNHFLQCWHPF